MEISNNRIEEILEYNEHLRVNDKASILETHEKLRAILVEYGSEEFGDCIVDEICQLFNFPNTNDVEPEEPTKVKFYLATYEPYESDEQPTREVVAVFVDEVQAVVNGERHFLSYAHIGQHSECSESFLRENCKEITDQEVYLELYNELLNLGYNLEVV